MAVKEVRSRLRTLIEDSGADSFQKRLLAERAVFLSIKLQSMEIDAVEGREFEMGKYNQGVNALVGLLRSLGLERAMKRPDTDLRSYVDSQDDEEDE
jgi:hypothetical protein